MRHVDVKDKVAELVDKRPDWASFVRFGDLTKLRRRTDGTFYRANYESGLLLDSLIRHYRPRHVLEIGTGRGFGALCMSRAMCHSGLEGRIVSIDVKGYEEPQEWCIDDGAGPRVDRLSLMQVWEKHSPADVRDRIELRQGTSMEVMKALLEQEVFRPDFVYIDGDHTYEGVRHDFWASFLLANRPVRTLLDDYSPRSDRFGVRRLVEEDLEPAVELEAIYTDRRWYGQPEVQTPLAEAEYAQVLFDSQRSRQRLENALPRHRALRIVSRYRRFGLLLGFWSALRGTLARRVRI